MARQPQHRDLHVKRLPSGKRSAVAQLHVRHSVLGMLHLCELQDTGWANLRPFLHCSPLQTSMHGACMILQQDHDSSC